ncbi:hypothetical protein AVU99_gp123 [Mycobacterium phage Lolly9]|uniref:Uncharacterized protein n=1 Tax=Mycobacterium phage Lolly9 TaxID=1698711 RepID=A0A0K2FNA9_9CAUD|nr:hypothetical protein AVU99_gp123 [Mycobacterium phage Lolly9]ALA48474.1 hypothetical protein LOLLY9_57 [Mycobacterium phage Lolly9]QOP65785.1 membrane protein [Mycobacterium phage MiniLon]QOP66532.1 membrane protein [Mycobacterium phage MiniMac]
MIVEALLTALVMVLLIMVAFAPWYVILALLLAFGAGYVYAGRVYEFPRRG